jgi:predicted PurR-regulated permease PerM
MSHKRDSLLPPLWILSSAAVVVSVWLAVELKELVVLLVIGFFIAYAIHPILEMLQSRGIGRSFGFALISAGAIGGIFLLGLTTVPTIVAEFERLSDNLHRYLAVGGERLAPLWEELRSRLPLPRADQDSVSEAIARLPQALSSLNGEAVKRVFTAIGGTLMQGYSRVLTIFNIGLLPFIVYYLAIDLPKIYSSVTDLVPLTKRKSFLSVCTEIDRYVSAFVRGQAIVCTILFALYAVGLWIIGVDLWLLLAAISGFGNIIPYVGFMCGIILSSLMALVTFGDFAHLVWVWVVYGIVQALEGTVITPKVVGESVGLSPLVVILALFAGGQLFGLLGIFLAIPAAAALRVLGRFSYHWVLSR